MKKHTFTFLLLSSFLWSCGGEVTSDIPLENEQQEVSTETTTTSEDIEQPEDNPIEEIILAKQDFNFQDNLDKKIVINRVSATSTALPQNQSSVYNCFDNDMSTQWKTITGTGPEEGIMIYLNEPTYVEQIVISDQNGDRIQNIEIYVDGGNYYDGMDNKISNIFIKANQNFNTKQTGTENEYKLEFDKNDKFQIAEIDFYLDKETEYEIVVPNRVGSSVTASSSLKPEVAYGASNLLDKQKENAWAENTKGLGIGEKITFDFNQEIEIDEIRFWNGYQRSKEHFNANGAIQELTLSNDQSTELITLDRSYKFQSITLDTPLKGSQLELVINKAFKGTKYQDLVLSEIQFLKNGTAYDVITPEESKRIQQNKNVENSLFQGILDKNFNFSRSKQTVEGNTTYITAESNSIILRSNNTFVLYDTEIDMYYVETGEMPDEIFNINRETIADGSWEIKKISEDKIEIRIFGKKFEPRDRSDIYKGEVENSTLKIFQDFLTITPDFITGKTITGKLPIK